MDAFYEHHQGSIRFRYRCFDRILLNGLIQPFQQPERVIGFFSTYRKQYPVSRNLLRGIAEQFQSWVKERSLSGVRQSSTLRAAAATNLSPLTSGEPSRIRWR